jgi:hypothetical protein
LRLGWLSMSSAGKSRRPWKADVGIDSSKQ